MQGLDNEFDNFGEGSSSSGGLAADHTHSEEHGPSTNVQHTPSNHNDMASNPQEVPAEPSSTTTRKRRRRAPKAPLTEEELKERSNASMNRKELKRIRALGTVNAVDLQRAEREKKLRQEEQKVETLRKKRALKAKLREAKKNAEDGQAKAPKRRLPSKPDSELTEKEREKRERLRRANERFYERQRERKRLAKGKPLLSVKEERIKQEEELLKEIQKKRERLERARLIQAKYYAKKREARLEAKRLAESNKPPLTKEEQEKRDARKKIVKEAGIRFRERQRAKQFLEQLAGTLQEDPARAQPLQQVESRFVGIEAHSKLIANVKEQVMAIRTKKGVSPDEPIQVEDLEVILPPPNRVLKRGRKNARRKKRTKADEEEEEEDTTPVVVPTALQPWAHSRIGSKLESRLFKKPRPEDLDPDAPDIQATTAAHLAYSLMTREQRLALTLSVLDPEKEFEAYRWPVRESVLSSVPASKYLDEDARPMPDSFERKGMSFVSELTGVPKSEHDYEISTSDEDEDDEVGQERLLDERRASKRLRKEQQEDEKSSTQRLMEVHRFFRDEVTTFAQKQYHKAFQHKKLSPYPDIKNIRVGDHDELTLLQENAAAFSAEDTLLGVLDRIPFVIRQGALGKNPEYVVQGRKPVASDASYERGWNSVMLAATMAGVDERILKKVSYRMKTLLSHSRNVYYYESEPRATVEAEEDQDQDDHQNQNPQEKHPEVEEGEHPEIEKDEHPEIEEEDMGVDHELHADTGEELLLPEHVFNKT